MRVGNGVYTGKLRYAYKKLLLHPVQQNVLLFTNTCFYSLEKNHTSSLLILILARWLWPVNKNLGNMYHFWGETLRLRTWSHVRVLSVWMIRHNSERVCFDWLDLRVKTVGSRCPTDPQYTCHIIHWEFFWLVTKHNLTVFSDKNFCFLSVKSCFSDCIHTDFLPLWGDPFSLLSSCEVNY